MEIAYSANLPSQVSPLQNTATKNLFQEIIAKNFFEALHFPFANSFLSHFDQNWRNMLLTNARKKWIQTVKIQ